LDRPWRRRGDGGPEDDPRVYDTAQVCPNGHVASAHFKKYQADREPFCARCGQATITDCPGCSKSIRGALWDGAGIGYSPSRFCIHCGKPFPWTERALAAADALVAEAEGLDAADRDAMKAAIPDLLAETPATSLAATRFKRLLGKVGPATAEGLKRLFAELIVEAAKRHIWPT